MNLIDIASWQQGLSLSEIFTKNPDLDGVIVKISQGTDYVTPCAKAWLDWLADNGKPMGTYHYLGLMGAEAEAQHYVESVRPWLGRAVLAIDYEDAALQKGTGYLKLCLDEVYRLTGIRPLVYCSQASALEAQDFTAIAAAGYRLWVAQYADYYPVFGFLPEPWHRGSPAPFPAYTMRQYTSSGQLVGWEKRLDFDLFYGSEADWTALAAAEPSPTPDPDPAQLRGPDPLVISELLHGKYGVGADRVAGLRADGYDPEAVQAKVNQLYGVAAKVRPLIRDEMEYVNSIMFIVSAQ